VDTVTIDTVTVSDLSVDDDVGVDDDDDDDDASAAVSAGHLDLVMRILAGMCDGQYTDLQVVTSSLTIDATRMLTINGSIDNLVKRSPYSLPSVGPGAHPIRQSTHR